MHLLVWDRESCKNDTPSRYNECLARALEDATGPTRSATELGILVAQYFEEKGITVSRIPLQQYVFEDEEEKRYHSDAWYEVEGLPGKKCRLNIYSQWLLWGGNEAVDISVSLHLYLSGSRERGFSPEEACKKYPPLAVENMAIFPGLDAVARVQGHSDLDTLLPLLGRYIDLTMRYENLVNEPVQRFHAGIERFFDDDAWPYDSLSVLVFGYVPFDSVEQIYIGGTWALFDNLCLRDAPPIEVGIIPIWGDVPFYPARQTKTPPAFAELYRVYTDVTGGQARIMAGDVRLLLSQNLTGLGFDEDDTKIAQELVRAVREIWELRILED